MANSNVVPFVDPVVNSGLTLTRSWEQFFRKIQDLVNYVPDEKSFTLVNNQSGAADIDGLSFDKRYQSQAIVEYLIQRVTTSSELVESGRVVAVYLPDSETWNVAKVADISVGTIGVTFSITSAGQIQYTTTNQAGTSSISRIVFRVREIKAKSSLYSEMG